MPWNPDQYHRFQRERFAPFEDLLSLINVSPGLHEVFMQTYRERWPCSPVVYPFRRILFAARRGDER